MPLTPHEKSALDAIEKALREQDPSFATDLTRARRALTRRTARIIGYLLALFLILAALAALDILGDPRPVETALSTLGLVTWWVWSAARAAERFEAAAAHGRRPDRGPAVRRSRRRARTDE